MLASVSKRFPTGFGIGIDNASQPLLLLVLTAAIPILLFGLWASHLSAEKKRSDSRRDILERVEDVTERVSSELQNHLGKLQGLAASTALDGDDLRNFYTEASRLEADNPLWHTVELADPSGAQVLNLLRPLGRDLGPSAERSSFDKVVQTRQPAVSGIGPIGPVSGLQLVALRVPVIRDNQLRFVLSVAFEPKSISAILRDAGVPAGWIGGVVDARGNLVARTLDEGFTIGSPASETSREAVTRAPGGFYRGKTLEGVDVEVAYQLLPHTDGWSVHFGISSELLDAPVEKSQYLLAGGGILSLVLAGVLSIVVARDMAQRRHFERTRATLMLQASEEHRAMALEAAALGTWRWNAENDRLEVCARAAELLGLPRLSPSGEISAWQRRHMQDAVHPDDRLRVDEAIQQCLQGDRPIEIEFRTVRRDESVHWVRLIGRCQRIEEDGPDLLQGVIADIDHRKQADARHNALLRQLAQAQEDERRHIARELHDQVGQTVTGLAFGLKGLEQGLEQAPGAKPLIERVHWLRNLTAEIGRDLHRVAANLRPTALDDLGLEKALRTYAADWSERYAVPVDIQLIGSDGRLPAETETVVYRVVQEALTNVLKHASASFVSILLERKTNHLRIIIEDNGRGFDTAGILGDNAAAGANGIPQLGLSGIRERLLLIGGSVMIESSPGAGTSLYVQVPVLQKQQRSDS
ncbi:sensor histidine kinase [Skermanella pratensis]|uniref:sensor histidine kinase n=1 Tax=Skermanella pratensis TaxID=2233999 RepID=UPI001300E61C|nr:ATP-binding protein [Skermanella pratensis]